MVSDSQPTHERRGFLRLMATGVLSIPFIAPIVAVARTLLPGEGSGKKPRPALPLREIPEDEPVSYRLRYEDIQGPYRLEVERLVFLRRTGDDVLALSAECTHAGCNVSWSGDKKSFVCPCHEGFFDLDGKPTGGPPQNPLRRFDVRTNGDDDNVLIEV